MPRQTWVEATGRPLGQTQGLHLARPQGCCGPRPRPDTRCAGSQVRACSGGAEVGRRGHPWAHSEPLVTVLGTCQKVAPRDSEKAQGVPPLLKPWLGAQGLPGSRASPRAQSWDHRGLWPLTAPLSSLLRSQNANFQNPRCENTPLIGRESPPPSVSRSWKAGGGATLPPGWSAVVL